MSDAVNSGIEIITSVGYRIEQFLYLSPTEHRYYFHQI